MLSAQKAFDVTDHNSLLRRLYLDGVQGDDWLLIHELYTDGSSRVKWAGLLSNPIIIRQGVRQGGVLSTSHFKLSNNPFLLQLRNCYTDVKIGSIYLSHITVADDLAVFARTYCTQQVKIWDMEDNTNRERYCVNPVKSSTLFYLFGHTPENVNTDICIAGDKISNDSNTTHLGIYRDTSDKLNIEEKISIGRKTLYSLRAVDKREYLMIIKDNFC